MNRVKDFFKGIKRGYGVGNKGGIMDVMWCASCKMKQPVYLDGSILKCAGCGKVIDASCGPVTIEVEAGDIE